MSETKRGDMLGPPWVIEEMVAGGGRENTQWQILPPPCQCGITLARCVILRKFSILAGPTCVAIGRG